MCLSQIAWAIQALDVKHHLLPAFESHHKLYIDYKLPSLPYLLSSFSSSSSSSSSPSSPSWSSRGLWIKNLPCHHWSLTKRWPFHHWRHTGTYSSARRFFDMHTYHTHVCIAYFIWILYNIQFIYNRKKHKPVFWWHETSSLILQFLHASFIFYISFFIRESVPIIHSLHFYTYS